MYINGASLTDRYTVCEQIGSGQFATVKRCVHKVSGKEFAAKFIRKKRTKSSRRGVALEDIEREVNILKKLNHENIVKLFDVFDDGCQVILILELVKGGELFDLLSGTQKQKLDETESVAFVKQILLGLQHMHNKNIAHLDLKPENIMLLERNSHKIKLIDFGLSRLLLSNIDVREMMGTPEFVAPEIISYEPVTLASDMWSLGVITYILLSGTSPFLGDTKQETFSNITAANYNFDEEYFDGVTDNAIDFIRKLLVKDERKRNTVQQCLNHDWILGSEQINSVYCEVRFNQIKPNCAYLRWKHCVKVITVCNRLNHLNRLRRNVKLGRSVNSVESSVSTSQNRESMEHDENLISATVFASVEEGNLAGLTELWELSKFDLNLANKHGETPIHIAAGLGHFEILKFLHNKGANLNLVDNHGDTAVYWAARQGHIHIIRYLYEHQVNVDLKNKIGETPIHVAARYGQAEAIEQLCRCGANINETDDHGETALHIAVWHGFAKIVHVLGDIGANGNVRNKDDETPLLCAAARGHTESVRYLLDNGVNLNLVDKYGNTALHLALRRHHTAVAVLLLNAGSNMEITDAQGERAIHIAAREGLLKICQILCTLNCSKDVCNKSGLYPIHLAAKNGHIEVVRCLCLSGCQIDRKNRDGITAEISAISQGHNNVAELLNRLSVEQTCSEYISQLLPLPQTIQRVTLKIFGHSAVGKTTLIESLKCGYFSSWFRKSSRLSVTSNQNKSFASISSSKSSLDSTPPLTPTSENNSLANQLTFNGNNEHYTKCIDIQQVNISGVGDMSIWEFSGVENYYQIYDHFIGSVNCFHLIVYRLCDPLDIQLKQVLYWLYFLKSRLPIYEPLVFCGKSKRAGKVALVASHADLTNTAVNNESDCEALLNIIKEKFNNIFDIYESVFIMDAHAVGSQAMKQLKQYLNNQRFKVIEGLPPATHFLHSVLTQLSNWRRLLASFPVLSFSQFTEMVREKVNPLAAEEHLKDLVQQLQVMGEVIYLKGKTDQDLLVFNPRWLTVDVIGVLLRPEYTNRNRITGCYSVDDIQALFPEIDALDLLQVLENLQLCTPCDIEGDIEYEFANFIKLEKPEELWAKSEPSHVKYCYGGVRLQCESEIPSGQLLTCLFHRLQTAVRQCLQEHPDIAGLTLYQWCNGCKLRIGFLEAIIAPTVLSSNLQYEAIDVKVRGPIDKKQMSFFFFEDLLNIIETSISNMCPSLILQRHYYSPTQLKEFKENPCTYSSPELIHAAMSFSGDQLLCNVKSQTLKFAEKFGDIVCFGLTNLSADLETRSFRKLSASSESCGTITQSAVDVKEPTLAPNLHVANITTAVKQKLCEKLDPIEPLGKDWCMLGVRLGLTDKLPKFDNSNNVKVSPTWRLLEECCREENCTIKTLVKKLEELGRVDAIDIIYRTTPILKIFPLLSTFDDGNTTNDESGIGSSVVSQASSSNLSR